jgi:hypothetical protein
VASCATNDPPKAKNPKTTKVEKEGLFIGTRPQQQHCATGSFKTSALPAFLSVKIRGASTTSSPLRRNPDILSSPLTQPATLHPAPWSVGHHADLGRIYRGLFQHQQCLRAIL